MASNHPPGVNQSITDERVTDERVTVADVRSVIGDIDDATAAAIVATGASIAELEAAYLYAQGYDDVVDRSGHSLTGRVAEIYEILTADEDLEPER